MNDIEKFKCLIIGSGPAGYTAAIYASRANLNPVLYTGQTGGQLMQTTDVENYPGYSDGIMGPEMMEDFRKQAERMGADLRTGFVTKVEFSRDGGTHKVWVDDKKEIHAETVIISTGATAKWLGLESEIRLRDNGGGVSACAVCDGFFYRGREVAIVGGGDTAAEEALYLANLCPTVHMFVRRDEMRASKVMQQRVFNAENIKMYWNTEVNTVLGEDEIEAVRVINNKTQELTDIAVDGLFIAIGHKPITDIFMDWLDMDSEGYLITQADSTKTNIAGVFVGGDAQDKIYRQAVTAAGTGCMAALDAERYISHKEFMAEEAAKLVD